MNFRFLLIFFLTFLWSEVNGKENAVSNVIAVVNLKEVALQSKAGKDIEKQIALINDNEKKVFLDVEANIKSMETDKKSNSDSRATECAQLMLFDKVRQKKAQIAEAYRVAISTLDCEIKKVIAKICQGKDIKIVIANDAVVYVDRNSPDITNEVVKAIDLTCSTIKIELKEQK
ncbi:MAG: OmpH family outer membrane protein [Holosporaceae bacterium]|jgi:Skp family chaperone for outer membrane proteins|nr:OmpH family outer membrane protein [Holosporaceae bacterium]